jgi:hypothetical protein
MNKSRYCIFYLIALAIISNCMAWQESDFYGLYDMNHDGWRGQLSLWHNTQYHEYYSPHNLAGQYMSSDGKVSMVEADYPHNSIPVVGLRGDRNYQGDNAIRILIYPALGGYHRGEDPQEFWGYLYSGSEAMAGVALWHGRPFGFYAIKKSPQGVQFEDSGYL